MAKEKTVKDTKEKLFSKLEDVQAKQEMAEAEAMKIVSELKELGVTKEEIEKRELDTFPHFNKE